MTDLPIAIAALGFLELPPAELISVVGAAGFAGISLRAVPASPGGVEYRLPPGSAAQREVLARMRDTGVRIAQVELLSLDRDTNPESYEPIMAETVALGCNRVMAAGNDPDLAVVTDRFAALCALAARYDILVDLEFMPFRPLQSLAQSDALLTRARAANGRIVIDTLHLFRAGGSVAELAAVDPARLGVVQLCDGPRQAPPPDKLADEARQARLVPGAGELPLEAVLRALPADIIIAAECPIERQYPQMSAAERAATIYRATRELIRRVPPGSR